MNTLTSLEYS